MSSKKSTGASSAPQGNSRRAQLRQQQEAEARRQRTMRMLAVAAAVLALAIAAIVGTVLVKDRQDKQSTAAAQATPPNANADGSGIVVNPGKAKDGAPTVTVYQDYQCPACKSAEELTGDSLNTLAERGDISLEYRTMTFLDVNLKNDSSVRAGVAAACADKAGAYAKYHDTVYANQPQHEGQGYTDQQLRVDFAQAAGISGQALTDFQSCYDSRATESFVKGTDEAAGKAGISSTPTYRVNGKDIDWRTLGNTPESALAAIKAAA